MYSLVAFFDLWAFEFVLDFSFFFFALVADVEVGDAFVHGLFELFVLNLHH